ncbi:MAG: hypothetical protein RL419_346 [Actinomycetota bacterium]|jgi:hypothetical protein
MVDQVVAFSSWPFRPGLFVLASVERAQPAIPTGYGADMKLGPGLTFSWKRALGITSAKRKISRATGIPLTRSGRRNKLGRWLGMK